MLTLGLPASMAGETWAWDGAVPKDRSAASKTASLMRCCGASGLKYRIVRMVHPFPKQCGAVPTAIGGKRTFPRLNITKGGRTHNRLQTEKREFLQTFRIKRDQVTACLRIFFNGACIWSLAASMLPLSNMPVLPSISLT